MESGTLFLELTFVLGPELKEHLEGLLPGNPCGFTKQDLCYPPGCQAFRRLEQVFEGHKIDPKKGANLVCGEVCLLLASFLSHFPDRTESLAAEVGHAARRDLPLLDPVWSLAVVERIRSGKSSATFPESSYNLVSAKTRTQQEVVYRTSVQKKLSILTLLDAREPHRGQLVQLAVGFLRRVALAFFCEAGVINSGALEPGSLKALQMRMDSILPTFFLVACQEQFKPCDYPLLTELRGGSYQAPRRGQIRFSLYKHILMLISDCPGLDELEKIFQSQPHVGPADSLPDDALLSFAPSVEMSKIQRGDTMDLDEDVALYQRLAVAFFLTTFGTMNKDPKF